MDTITQNFHDWDLQEEDKILVKSKKRGILELSEEDMKEPPNLLKRRVLKLLN